MGCELAPGRGVSLREMAVIGQSRGVGPQLGAPGCCQQGGVRAQTWGGMVWGGSGHGCAEGARPQSQLRPSGYSSTLPKLKRYEEQPGYPKGVNFSGIQVAISPTPWS